MSPHCNKCGGPIGFAEYMKNSGEIGYRPINLDGTPHKCRAVALPGIHGDNAMQYAEIKEIIDDFANHLKTLVDKIRDLETR